MDTPDHLIFFDGECNLCSGAVQFIITRDKREIFSFASIQSETARKLLPPELQTGIATVYRQSGTLLTESTAVLAILAELGGVWYALSLLRILPKFLRDPMYHLIAKYRFFFFGKPMTCMVPMPEWDKRFLP